MTDDEKKRDAEKERDLRATIDGLEEKLRSVEAHEVAVVNHLNAKLRETEKAVEEIRKKNVALNVALLDDRVLLYLAIAELQRCYDATGSAPCKVEAPHLRQPGSVSDTVDATIRSMRSDLLNAKADAAELRDQLKRACEDRSTERLRDQFAMAALSSGFVSSALPDATALRAYQIADAMLRWREPQTSEKKEALLCSCGRFDRVVGFSYEPGDGSVHFPFGSTRACLPSRTR